MIVKLKSYLAKLEDEERFKSVGERRVVPTITDLAKEAGVSRVQMQRVVSGDIQSLKLTVGGSIIKILRQRGFDADVNDILEYRD